MTNMTTARSEIIDLDPGWAYDDAFPFTPARQIGNMIYVAGQVALDPDGNLVGEGDIEAQTRQVFANIRTILALAGAGFEDIVKLNAYVTDRSHYRSTIKVRKELFVRHPAATVVIVAGLGSPQWLIEVDVVAVAP